MVLCASTQLVNSPKNTGRIATLWPLFLQTNTIFETRNIFRPEDQNLLHSFKRWNIWADVILYICSSKSLHLCNSASWNHRRRRLSFLSTVKMITLSEAEHFGWSWVLWLKLCTPSAAEHSAWSGALWLKLRTLSEAEQCGWSDSDLTCFRKSLFRTWPE